LRRLGRLAVQRVLSRAQRGRLVGLSPIPVIRDYRLLREFDLRFGSAALESNEAQIEAALIERQSIVGATEQGADGVMWGEQNL